MSFFVFFCLCITQFQLRPPLPPPSPGYCGAFARLVSPGGGAFANFALPPRAWHLPTPGPSPSFWHGPGFLSEYNYREDFTGKTSRLAHCSRTGKDWRGLQRHVLDFMHAFLHCLSSQNYIAKLGSYQGESTFFWLLNQVSLDIISRTSFHIYKTIQ